MLSSGGGFNAYGISIRYQASDFAGSTSSAVSASKIAVPSSTITQPPITSSASPTLIPIVRPGHSGLSGGAIAGTVVGVVVGLALLSALLYGFWLRKRRAAAMTPVSASTQPSYGPKPSEGYAPAQYPLEQYTPEQYPPPAQEPPERYTPDQHLPPAQLHSSPLLEAMGSTPADRPHELSGGHHAHELEG
ncbi:MAG: hypothetical protein M1818_002610 [Claussenomyces sp. TS43310]|nr:MAG: hypothetical protein M1818_002610 [Claussenomyces sp. TS43310]